MFTGFLKVGDVEIINDARAKGYAESAECPLSWHQCDCDGLADATGTGAFVHADVRDAPWYDPRNPESERFYGVTGIALRDLASSTLRRDVVEGVTNGGVAGQSRFAGKTIRVRAWLSADGMDALEYGMSWLKAALSDRRCAQHEYSCVGAGAEFFVDCPPPRAIVPDYTEWVTVGTNLATNPSFEVDAGIPAGATRTRDWSKYGASSLAVPYPSGITIDPLETTVGLTDIEPSGARGDLVGAVQPGLYPIPPLSRLDETGVAGVFTLGGGVPGLVPTLNFVPLAEIANQTIIITPRNSGQQVRINGVVVATTIAGVPFRYSGTGSVEVSSGWWDGLLIAGPDYSGAYFDGSTQGDATNQFLWVGESNASASTWQTRTYSTRPETDDEYLPRVDAVTRVLHGVSAISGPLEVNTVQSSDGRHWGREVEFTLYSEQPGIYGKPRDLGTLVSIGEVVDDVVRNLVPYPSAELSQNKVVVAYNYVTNPSLEVADTNWSGAISTSSDTPGSPAIGTFSRGVVRGARSYAGDASYLARWLGDKKTVGSGQRVMSVEYEQRSMPGLAAGDHVTVTVWGALVVQSGTALGPSETLSASFQWIDMNGNVVDGASLGTASGEERGGKVFSLSGLIIPSGATGIRFRLSSNSMNVYSSPDAAVNRDIRVYADAAGVIEEVS